MCAIRSRLSWEDLLPYRFSTFHVLLSGTSTSIHYLLHREEKVLVCLEREWDAGPAAHSTYLRALVVLVWGLKKWTVHRPVRKDLSFGHKFFTTSCMCFEIDCVQGTSVCCYKNWDENGDKCFTPPSLPLTPHTHTPSLPVHQHAGLGRHQERGLGDGSQRPCDKAISPHESSSELTVNTNWCH